MLIIQNAILWYRKRDCELYITNSLQVDVDVEIAEEVEAAVSNRINVRSYLIEEECLLSALYMYM